MINNINKESKSKSKKGSNKKKKNKNLSKINIKNNSNKTQKNSSKLKNIPDYIKVNSFPEGRIKRYSYYSKPGRNIEGFQKINQDSYLIMPNINNMKDFNIFGIMDGHGTDGHFISSFVSKYFSKIFKANFNQKENNLDYINYIIKENNFALIKNIFINAEKELNNFNPKNLDPSFSGTTCIILIQIGNRIICANVGDSKAIMIKTYDRIIPLSIDHKPELFKESKRILNYGGEICQMEEYGKRIGPFRVWKKEKNILGLIFQEV